MKNQAPIALFVYNRLWHTRQCVEALRRNTFAEQSDLFVFSDAPKRPDAAAAVQEVRDYIATVSGFRKVHTIVRTANLGLANSIIDGVGRLCEEYLRVIVLEDDLVTSAYFLEYMNTALRRYRAEERVMQVAGYMFPTTLEMEEDALFLPFISSWGWATWQRAWLHFDSEAKDYERLCTDAALRKKFNLDGHYDYFGILRAQQRGRIDSWAARWYLSVFFRHGLALYPKKTLVRNLGFDGSGVNCAVSKLAQDDLSPDFRAVALPPAIEVSRAAEQVMRNMPVPELSLASVLNRLTGFLGGR